MRLAATALLAIAEITSLGCRDREQEARATGERARAEVATRCAGAPPAPSADPLERAEARAACAERACADACRAYEGSSFRAACAAACLANAECATDADCGAALRCAAIAPRVRRCVPR